MASGAVWNIIGIVMNWISLNNFRTLIVAWAHEQPINLKFTD